MSHIVDICIIIMILFGGVIGFSRGAIRTTVSVVGFLLVLILSYLLKDTVSNFFYLNAPFFEIGAFENVKVLNILAYETIAFVTTFCILALILKLAIKVSVMLEMIVKATLILSLPSKLIGMVLGLAQYYVVTFLILTVMSLPSLGLDFQSDVSTKILTETPVLSEITNTSLLVFEEFNELKSLFTDSSISADEFNVKALEVFLKYKVISSESVKILIETGKIKEYEGIYEMIENNKENI